MARRNKPRRPPPRRPGKRHPHRPRPADQPPGGPNRWEPRKIDIERAAEEIAKGATMQSVALPILRCSIRTLHDYLAKNPESHLSQSIQDASSRSVIEIERATFITAKKGNAAAQRLFLHNKNPEAWRDRVQLIGDKTQPVEATVTHRGAPKDLDLESWGPALAAIAKAVDGQRKAKG